MALSRAQISKIVGGDAEAIRAFERILNDVQAGISGPAMIVLDYTSTGTLNTPLPALYSYTLSAGVGQDIKSGITWGVTVLSGSFTGPSPTMGGTGTGILQINSGLATPSVSLAVTARVNGRGYPPFTVTINRSTAFPDNVGGNSADATGSLNQISTGTFVAVTRDLAITTPAGVTSANLTAPLFAVGLTNALPTGTTTVELKWQRETSPGVWSDVGTAATSSPDANVVEAGDPGFPFYIANPGSITCNRTETGLTAATAYKFRLMGRISAGNLRGVTLTGTATASA